MLHNLWHEAPLMRHSRDEHERPGTRTHWDICVSAGALVAQSVHGGEVRLTMWQKTLMAPNQSAHHVQNGGLFFIRLEMLFGDPDEIMADGNRLLQEVLCVPRAWALKTNRVFCLSGRRYRVLCGVRGQEHSEKRPLCAENNANTGRALT